MNSKVWKIGLVVGIVVVLGLSAVVVSGQGMRGGQGQGWGDGRGFGFGFGRDGDSLVAITAETLGIEQTDLIAQLQEGKSIADIAAENDVALDTIVDAVIADRSEELAAAVEAGSLTQEEADAMLVLMRSHITEHLSATFQPRGFGFGQGFVDEDGDGFCDNCPMPGQGGGMFGQGMHGGMMGGHGHGHGMMQGGWGGNGWGQNAPDTEAK